MLSRIRRYAKILKWKSIHRGPRRDITVDTWNGVLTCDSHDWLIGKYLYVNRSYEQSAIQNTMELLRRDGYLPRDSAGTVLDVGANIGMIAIALLRENYFQRAIAFEPDPNNYRLLVKNVAQNGLDSRIVTFACGLTSPALMNSTGGAAALELSPDNFGDHRIRHGGHPGFFKEENRSTVPVRLRTLDQVFSGDVTLHAEEVALVWIDIQGHEGHFLEGAHHFLSRRIPVVSEFWPYAILRSGMTLSTYQEILRSLFTHFYSPAADGHFDKKPIAELPRLAEKHTSPRSGDQIILVRD